MKNPQCLCGGRTERAGRVGRLRRFTCRRCSHSTFVTPPDSQKRSDAAARREARDLVRLVRRGHMTNAHVFELLAVTPKQRDILKKILSPAQQPGVEKLIAFRAQVRKTFDRLMARAR
jgi:hypothetical protein